MRSFRLWHLLLVPLPLVGWLLLLAYGMDEILGEDPEPVADETDARISLRLQAAALDYAVVVLAWALLPPAVGWLVGALYLLFRDAARAPASLGRRIAGAQHGPGLSFTASFARNLPLLVPYLGPLVETLLVVAGRHRLGDYLAGVPR